MTEMLDRAARAIQDAMIIDHGDGLYHPDDMARAAIEAIREPTMMVCVAGETILDGETSEAGFAVAVWQAMIDAALKEDGKT
ncbi:MAG: hypothetical protein ACR2PS_18445 [Pseudomonadales bacterium]